MSEKLLPIVPGCKAIVLESLFPNDIGKEVVAVIKWVDPVDDSVWWRAKADFIPSSGPDLYRERCLMRIDGGEFDHEKEEDQAKFWHNKYLEQSK